MVKMLESPKGAVNIFTKVKYRTIDDILKTVKKSGQSVILSDDIVNFGDRLFIKATAVSGDASATAYAEIDLNHKGFSKEQTTGSASTYARKYALCGLFGISTDDDPDATKPQKSLMLPSQRAELINLFNNNKDELLKYIKSLGIDPAKITEEEAKKVIEKKKGIR